MSSLKFLAENAHRTPRTVRGWYLYHKTKNYRIMLGAAKGGAREALKLGGLMLGWVAIEEGMERVGCGDVKEIGAGLGTAAAFSFICRFSESFQYRCMYVYNWVLSPSARFPWRMTQKTVVLGVGVGCVMRGLRWMQESMRKRGGYEGGG
jgi:hypothetical protein